MTMKVVVRNNKRERPSGRSELEIDVGGLTEWEAEDFVEEVKRRVSLKKPRRSCSTDDYREKRRERRVTIDVNVHHV